MTRTVKRPQGKQAAIANLEALEEARRETKILKSEIDTNQAAAIEAMDKAGVQILDFQYGDEILVARVMRNSSLVIDEDALRKELGEKLWAKVTSQTLDKKRLEALIDLGEIDPVVVAQVSREKPIAPFIRINPMQNP